MLSLLLSVRNTVLGLALGAVCLSGATFAQEKASDKSAPFETSAKQVLLYDHSTRSVLFERDADKPVAPASLAKLMTIALVFREIAEGRLSAEKEMVVSVDAWRRGGAVSGNPNMLLTPNKVLKVGELLTGLVVGGANDAALTFAENIAGREDRFVEMMNAHARELKLENTVFRNATGYGAEGQVATLRSLVKLAAHLIDRYPEQYALFAQRDFPLGRNRQVSRNPLLTMDIGADGLMTGYLPETGQALVGSAVQDGRRIILAAAGFDSVSERALESRKLIEWGFRRFEIRTLFPAGVEIGQVSVFGGVSASAPVRTASEIRLPALRGTNEGMTLRLAYRGPVPAPIRVGDEIARLDILIDNRLIQSAPLVASSDVERGGVLARARDAALEASRQIAKGGFAWLLEKVKPKKSETDAPGKSGS